VERKYVVGPGSQGTNIAAQRLVRAEKRRFEIIIKPSSDARLSEL
jgi:hypothetical protein